MIERFQVYCHQAEERCHLYREGDELDDVKRRFESVLSSLAEQPRVYAVKGSMPVYVTYSTMKAMLFSTTYVPVTFPIVAIVFDALHRKLDLSSFLQPMDPAPLCESKPRDPRMSLPDDGGTAVMCSDQSYMVITHPKSAMRVATWSERLANPLTS